MEPLTLLRVSLAVGAFALTVTRGTPFRPVRAFISRRSPVLGELFRCPFCMSHYLAAAAIACGGYWRGPWFDTLTIWGAIIAIASLLAFAVIRLSETAAPEAE